MLAVNSPAESRKDLSHVKSPDELAPLTTLALHHVIRADVRTFLLHGNGKGEARLERVTEAGAPLSQS